MTMNDVLPQTSQPIPGELQSKSPPEDTKNEKAIPKTAEPQEATPVSESEAPEQDNIAKTEQDPRPPHQTQPPTKEQY